MANRARTRRQRKGALLIDVLIGVFMLTLAAAAFFALIPMIHKSQTVAKEESVAQAMAQRMVEQVQMLQRSDMTAVTLTKLNLIDTGQSQPPYSFSNIPMDQGSRYSPSQALRAGTATLDVNPADANSMRVDVTISWKSATGKNRSFKTGTILGGYQ
ncbi:MAG: hypothetical protein KF784_15405 [Fimbriimonadaceae bacterium]|nr:hypothetical protein [Fimbriimonadaceae bacterium]